NDAYIRNPRLLDNEDSDAAWRAINDFVAKHPPNHIASVLHDLEPGLAKAVSQQALILNKAYADFDGTKQLQSHTTRGEYNVVPPADSIKALQALKPGDLDRDSAAWRTMHDLVAWANAPLQEKQESRWTKDVPQAHVNYAMLRLEQATRELPSWLAAAGAKKALSDYERSYKDNRESPQNDRLYTSSGGSATNPTVRRDM